MKYSKIFLRTAVAYVRAFKKESVNIYSLSEQEKAITDFASENGYRILRVFREENISARTFERPAFKEMMEYLKSNKWKVKFLIVTDLKRLSADPRGLSSLLPILRRNGIKPISIVQSMLKYVCKQPPKAL